MLHIYLQLLYLLGLILDQCNIPLSLITVCFKVYFVRYEYFYLIYLLISICMEDLYPTSHLQSVCIFRSEVSFL